MSLDIWWTHKISILFFCPFCYNGWQSKTSQYWNISLVNRMSYLNKIKSITFLYFFRFLYQLETFLSYQVPNITFKCFFTHFFFINKKHQLLPTLPINQSFPSIVINAISESIVIINCYERFMGRLLNFSFSVPLHKITYLKKKELC